MTFQGSGSRNFVADSYKYKEDYYNFENRPMLRCEPSVQVPTKPIVRIGLPCVLFETQVAFLIG